MKRTKTEENRLDRQTNRQTDLQTNRQTERQTQYRYKCCSRDKRTKRLKDQDTLEMINAILVVQVSKRGAIRKQVEGIT